MADIKAIETRYKGCRFRSRLEARWAVFFDSLGIKWEYEKEGYSLPSGNYLPDFWLPEAKLSFEVKGVEPTAAEVALCSELAVVTEFPALIVGGDIGIEEHEYFGVQQSFKAKLLYGSPELYARHCLPTSGINDDCFNNRCHAFHSGYGSEHLCLMLVDFVLRSGETIQASGSIERFWVEVIEADKRWYRKTHGHEHPKYENGWQPYNVTIREFTGHGKPLLYFTECGCGDLSPSKKLLKAYEAARSARFEHGEQG
jgi:hypothetical protein